jgi:hypothetical protein
VDDSTRDLILRTVNAAVSNQLGRKLPTAIEQGVTAAMGPITESIANLTKPPEGGGDGKGNQSPEMAELLRKQKALEGELAAERQARQTQETQTKETRRNSALQNALAKHGVEPLRMKGAMAEVLGQVQDSDDGQLFFRDTSKGYDNDLSLDDGIKSWASTDVGKSYLAPKDVGGSGQNQPGRGGGPRPGARAADPATAKAQRIAEARVALRGQVREMIGGGAGVNLGGGPGGEGEG